MNISTRSVEGYHSHSIYSVRRLCRDSRPVLYTAEIVKLRPKKEISKEIVDRGCFTVTIKRNVIVNGNRLIMFSSRFTSPTVEICVSV